MSVFKYRTIELKVVNTREVIRRNIMSADGTTYLYTQHTFDFDCIYNPQATSAVNNGGAGVAPTAVAGRYPAETDAALHHYLSQPRGTLEVRMGNGALITSPVAGFSCDAKNGPIVEACDIVKVGERTWTVRFRITTWVNECTGGNPLVSHRWRRYVDVDQDYFATVVTEGLATFRVDKLLAAGTYPDAYRRDLFHPIPPNFKREHIHVEATEDGTGVRYAVVDKEQAFNLGYSCPATRIEAYQTAWYSRPDPVATVIDSIPQAAGNAMQAGQAGGPWAAAGSAVGSSIQTIRKVLPRFNLRVFCRAWGHRNSSRFALTALAVGLCMNRIGATAFRGEEMILTQDLTGKFVEFDATVTWGIESATVNNGAIVGLMAVAGPAGNQLVGQGGLAAVPFTWQGLMNTFPINEEINIGNMTLSQNSGIINPLPPGGKMTRGTWLGKLVAQALSGSCVTPPAPPSHVQTSEISLY